MTAHFKHTILSVALLTASHPVLAHTGEAQFVHMATMLRASAEICNVYSDDELDELQDHQRAAIAAIGVSPAEFDRMFKANYEKAKNMLATLSQSEKAKLCDDLEKIPIMEWR